MREKSILEQLEGGMRRGQAGRESSSGLFLNLRKGLHKAVWETRVI